MPGSKALNKAARSAERKRLRNRSVRTSVKTRVAKAEKLISAKEELAHQESILAMSSIDKAVKKGVIHRKKGARLKSRLMRKLNAAVVGPPGPEPGEGEAEQSQEVGG